MTARETFHEIRNYLAGQFVGATRDETILAEVIKCLFAANTTDSEFLGNMRLASAVEIARHYRAVFNRVRVEYPEFFDSEDELLLGPEALAWTMRQLSHLLVEQNGSDVIGDAYEVFMGSALRGQEGQFFTPRNATPLSF